MLSDRIFTVINCFFLFLPISFTEKWIPNVIISHRYKAQDTPARRTFEQALTGAFMSAVIKDLRPSALPFVASLIRHYTMVAVAQQCGEGLVLSVLSISNISFVFCSGTGSPLSQLCKKLTDFLVFVLLLITFKSLVFIVFAQ